MKRKCLAFGIILLFVGTAIIPSMAQNNGKPSLPTSRGDWLYVGGSGPGNYTKIQDAIDNASDGDTVFVYDDSSPYHETVEIDKSINLVGEDKFSTIIDGYGLDRDVVSIYFAHNVLLTGFTIQNGTEWWGVFLSGISMISYHCIVRNNIIQNNIAAGLNIMIGGGNIIQDNIIRNNYFSGISLMSLRNIISNNTVTNNEVGIELFAAYGNKIFKNDIHQNERGIWLAGINSKNTVYQNNITENEIGISIEDSSNNYVFWNNVFDNGVNAEFIRCPIMEELSLKMGMIAMFTYPDFIYYSIAILLHRVIGINHWFGNYWGEPYQFPQPIHGGKHLLLLSGFVQIFLQHDDGPPINLYFPLLRFDWNPAHEPYDIGG